MKLPRKAPAIYRYKQGEEKETELMFGLIVYRKLESKDSNAVDFVENFKLNLYAEEIFVFTLRRLKSLPQGSSALDFAYSIHTETAETRGKSERKQSPFPHT